MDPRRARDPRLARADPRLQRMQGNAPSQPQFPTAGSSQMDTGEPSSQIEPQPHPANAPLQPENVEEIDSLERPAPLPVFKPRPLFCVVCASNQVSLDDF